MIDPSAIKPDEVSCVDAYGQPVGPPVPDWSPRPVPPREPLQGRTCRLEPIDASRHAAALHAAFAEAPDDRDWTWLPDERPADAAAFHALAAAREASRDPLHMAVVVDGEACGTIALMRIDPAHGVVEIGHVAFAPRLKRTAAATEAVALLMRRAFDLGYRRLEWKCHSRNGPSRRAALRLGFTYEGTFRQAVVVKGRNRDTAWYSMLDGEWPACRTALVQWLEPQNFDGDGRQKRGLASLRAEVLRSGA